MPDVNASSMSDGIAFRVLEFRLSVRPAWQRNDALRLILFSPPRSFRRATLQRGWRLSCAALAFLLRSSNPEVTENILLDDHGKGSRISRRNQDLGSIAFDDPVPVMRAAYLKKFLLDRPKIDKSFVSELLATSDDTAIDGRDYNLK